VAAAAHIGLSRLGISSLKEAHECIRKTTSEEERRSKDDVLQSLGFEYLKENKLSLVKECLTEMSPGALCNILALYLSSRYLESCDFENALTIIPFFSESSMETTDAFGTFISVGKRANNIEFALKAFEQFKLKCSKNAIEDILCAFEDFLSFKGSYICMGKSIRGLAGIIDEKWPNEDLAHSLLRHGICYP